MKKIATAILCRRTAGSRKPGGATQHSEISESGNLAPHSKPVKIPFFCPVLAVNFCAVLELGEFFSSGFFVTVDLPAAGALTAVGTLADKAPDVLRRIPQEQSDFVGECFFPAQFSCQLTDAFFAVFSAVALTAEDFFRCTVGQIPLQVCGTEQIEQCFCFRKAQGKQPKSLMAEPSVQLPHLLQQGIAGFERAGEHIAGLQAGQCWRTVSDEAFFGHIHHSGHFSGTVSAGIVSASGCL